ncbi:MAG: hypothetical protein JSW73_00415 [Candidatus Woesearchaeota archaeon]|nr:MAG: hypothetical protein JSW73_00415 [Candidatus Woesearchaeota archaeon]
MTGKCSYISYEINFKYTNYYNMVESEIEINENKQSLLYVFNILDKRKSSNHVEIYVPKGKKKEGVEKVHSVLKLYDFLFTDFELRVCNNINNKPERSFRRGRNPDLFIRVNIENNGKYDNSPDIVDGTHYIYGEYCDSGIQTYHLNKVKYNEIRRDLTSRLASLFADLLDTSNLTNVSQQVIRFSPDGGSSRKKNNFSAMYPFRCPLLEKYKTSRSPEYTESHSFSKEEFDLLSKKIKVYYETHKVKLGIYKVAGCLFKPYNANPELIEEGEVKFLKILNCLVENEKNDFSDIANICNCKDSCADVFKTSIIKEFYYFKKLFGVGNTKFLDNIVDKYNKTAELEGWKKTNLRDLLSTFKNLR